ncbi:lysophospholipase L1-like esterase [Pacificibacter maritimus]|uniref:Lysophospholipase L1-like esterase n=1 Tax=Pacificibacter maritimus TaxID=762213 RepID=A0A3N4UJZ7_9RHOB|nr:GDSL-type esterase/lipase family protein [Pacificibacter maritimus]RPE70996.1 lysophospholipase L1-like esterase [Pacificibacter maritimus]
MPTILCFGDSNTYGTPPISDLDHIQPRMAQRWPIGMAEKLGWTLIEEGLPGRTFQYPCPMMGPHMDGRVGLFMALESHGPLDAVVIMLGTNDLKAHFEASPSDVVAGASFFLDVCLSDEMQARHGGFEPIIIAPPLCAEISPLADEFAGAASKTAQVTAGLKALCEARDIAFFDAGSVVKTSTVDGIHLNEEAHARLGVAVADFITSEVQED